MNAKQQREWEDDVTQPCAFPEPLAEVLTRENRELRAEVERLDQHYRDWQKTLQDEYRKAGETWDRQRERLTSERDGARAIAADATTAAQSLRDELQGAQERLRRVRELADCWIGLGDASLKVLQLDRRDYAAGELTMIAHCGEDLRAALDAEP